MTRRRKPCRTLLVGPGDKRLGAIKQSGRKMQHNLRLFYVNGSTLCWLLGLSIPSHDTGFGWGQTEKQGSDPEGDRCGRSSRYDETGTRNRCGAGSRSVP